jgi:hypothetical protein
MRASLVLALTIACGKGEGTTQSNPAPAPSGKKGATGEIKLSGALAGTFKWTDDLAMDTCGYVADTKVGGLGVTMTDGKGAFISLTATDDNAHVRKIVLTSGKLKLPHAGSMTGSAGFEMTGTQSGDDSTVSVVYRDAVVTADGQTVTINGQLVGNCK